MPSLNTTLLTLCRTYSWGGNNSLMTTSQQTKGKICSAINCNDCNGCNAMNDNDHKIIISHYHSWRRWRSRKRHRSSAILCMRLWKSCYITRSSRKRLSLPAHLWSFLMTFLITWIQWVWNIVVQNKQSHHWLSMTCLALNYDLKGISQWQIRLQSDDKINNKSKNTQPWMLSIITIVQLATKTNMHFLYSYSETHARSCWELIFVCQKYKGRFNTHPFVKDLRASLVG